MDTNISRNYRNQKSGSMGAPDKKGLTLNETATQVSEMMTEGGRRLTRYEYKDFDDLERAFLRNFDALREGGYSTKAIGFALLVFKYDRGGK